MRILVTNDDGILSEGMLALASCLQNVGEVFVVAPDKEQSATGHAITMHHPLKVNKIKYFNTNIPAYSVNGTPADCVKLAVEALLKDKKPDIVVSGINNGPNLGTDVIYSGTVSAAVEASILDIPSIAVSMGSRDIANYDDAAAFASKTAKKILHSHDLSKVIININYPTCPHEKLAGVKITTLGIRKYENSFEERKDPRGNSYYWISGTIVDVKQNEDSDIEAIKNNYVSITPIHFDLTHLETFEQIKHWSFEL